jgi:GT2 family glycosyltransferase
MFWTPERQAPSAWVEHVPFAFWLVDVLRPRRIVELGTHTGVSYSAMCQAVKTLGLATSCFAIDTWKGDEHASFYGEEVYRDFAAFHDPRYGAFSQLVPSTFDNALHHFEDGSIDLLHIDGMHTYEAVRHDYESWRPTLAANAVVLFHDTDVRDRDFGVFRLWNEIATGRPHFSFLHGYGLGVLGHGQDHPDALQSLFVAGEDSHLASAIRETFATLGRSARLLSERRDLDQVLSGEVGKLREALAARDDQLAVSRQEHAQDASEIGRLQNTLSARDDEFAVLRQERAQEAGEIGRLQNTLSARVDELANIQQKLAESIRESDRLRHGLAVREAQVKALDSVISALNASTSWRITTPLRLTSTCARWLLRAARRMPRLATEAFLARVVPRVLPYYRRFLPERVRIFVSIHLVARLRRPIAPDSVGVMKGQENWILENETLRDDDRNLIRSHIASFGKKPKFSILMPVYNTPAPYLREAIDSVISQLYSEWQLCIADDASTVAEVGEILRSYARSDSRIRLRFRQVNGGISACTNTALEMAAGEWIVLMDHDDTLAEHALYLLAEAVNRVPDLTILYSDEDQIDENGRHSSPYFKPDWDYDLSLGQNLINHLGAYRADLVGRVGGFREGFEGSQDWDFALRILAAGGNWGVEHIPFVLYHARHAPISQGSLNSSLVCAVDAARRAVSDHLKQTGQAAEVTPSAIQGYLDVRRVFPAQRPLVSIIIPTKDRHEILRTCVDGLVNRTSYKPIEIVVVDNGSSQPDALDFLAEVQSWPGFKVMRDTGPFNFSRLVNRGVAASSGEICLLLNNDIDVINADWLDELVVHALRSDVGAVGAKLYYADDTVQHAGVILGIGGVAAHPHKSAQRNADGYFGRLKLTHSLSCVTAACVAVRRSVYDEVGGFDEKNLAVAFNDVDFCIRVREAGYRIIWTPHAELYHYESVSRGVDTTPEKSARFLAEIKHMRAKWSEILDNDPFYNPNLSLASEFFEPAIASRCRKPWLARIMHE